MCGEIQAALVRRKPWHAGAFATIQAESVIVKGRPKHSMALIALMRPDETVSVALHVQVL